MKSEKSPGSDLFDKLDAAAQACRFSGAVRVDYDGHLVDERAYGLADRAYNIDNSVNTRFGVASVTKGFTALVIGTLIQDGVLAFDMPVREILKDDLPLINDRVTIRHLLTHTSGIGDYFDESGTEDFNDYVMPVPVHTLDSTAAYLPSLDGHPQVFEPGLEFAYNNSGFVTLALIAERLTNTPFPELVTNRVFKPANMQQTTFPRSDELPGDIARGYLHDDGLRTNLLHLPVLGSGDGGSVTTVADLAKFWAALLRGDIVNTETLELLIEPIQPETGERLKYASGFWRSPGNDEVILSGGDAGISAYTSHNLETGITWTILSNTTNGAWHLLGAIEW
jgi:CubicO group peptidase (beta-lactamase class C family)